VEYWEREGEMNEEKDFQKTEEARQQEEGHHSSEVQAGKSSPTQPKAVFALMSGNAAPVPGAVLEHNCLSHNAWLGTRLVGSTSPTTIRTGSVTRTRRKRIDELVPEGCPCLDLDAFSVVAVCPGSGSKDEVNTERRIEASVASSGVGSSCDSYNDAGACESAANYLDGNAPKRRRASFGIEKYWHTDASLQVDPVDVMWPQAVPTAIDSSACAIDVCSDDGYGCCAATLGACRSLAEALSEQAGKPGCCFAAANQSPDGNLHGLTGSNKAELAACQVQLASATGDVNSTPTGCSQASHSASADDCKGTCRVSPSLKYTQESPSDATANCGRDRRQLLRCSSRWMGEVCRGEEHVVQTTSSCPPARARKLRVPANLTGLAVKALNDETRDPPLTPLARGCSAPSLESLPSTKVTVLPHAPYTTEAPLNAEPGFLPAAIPPEAGVSCQHTLRGCSGISPVADGALPTLAAFSPCRGQAGKEHDTGAVVTPLPAEPKELCSARVWSSGKGDRCRRPAVAQTRLCDRHHLASPHGEVDQPIPADQVFFFLFAQSLGIRTAQGGG